MKTFAILGCGMIAEFHAAAIEGIKDAVLKGAADVDYENAKRFAKEKNIIAYRDYDELLSDSEIDAVCICTPNAFHAQEAVKALDVKKHVVLEKPMAISVEGADKIIEACSRSECCLTVISQLRLSEDIQRTKRIIEEGSIGRILSADLYMKYWRDPSYYSMSAWKGTYALDGGGALINQGIHGVDILQYMVGVPRILSAAARTLFHDMESEDIIVAIAEFENGALGVIQASTCLRPGFDRRIEIIGTNGCITLEENTMTKLVIDGKDVDVKNGDAILKSNSSANPSDFPVELHRAQFENFIKAIDKEEALLIDAFEGRKAVEIICDIYAKSKKEQNDYVEPCAVWRKKSHR